MPMYEISTTDVLPTKELLRVPMEPRGYKATSADFSTWVGLNPLPEDIFQVQMEQMWQKTLGHPVKVTVKRIPETIFNENGVGGVSAGF